SQEEKQVYELVDGRQTATEIVEVSRLSDFDTNKALYELLTRDLIEEVRGQAAVAAVAPTPVDESEVAETPVPLPLVLFLALVAVASIATSFKNPLNSLSPLRPIGRASAPVETRKAISVERIHTLGNAIEEYNVVTGHLPARLQDLAPYFASSASCDRETAAAWNELRSRCSRRSTWPRHTFPGSFRSADPCGRRCAPGRHR